jgi:hypothetical protein
MTSGVGERGDGSAFSLSQGVQPIFTNQCAFAGCHAGSDPQQGMNLSHGMTYSNVVNVPARQLPSMMRIRPFQPDSSYLVHKIQGTHLNVGGSGSRMPLGGQLSQREIDLIRAWVSAGAPNN